MTRCLPRHMLFALKLALALTETLTLALALAAAEMPAAAQVAPDALISPSAWNVATVLLARASAGSFSATSELNAAQPRPSAV